MYLFTNVSVKISAKKYMGDRLNIYSAFWNRDISSIIFDIRLLWQVSTYFPNIPRIISYIVS